MHMSLTILKVPVPISLKNEAEQTAKSMGFESVVDLVQKQLVYLVNKKKKKAEYLSKAAEKRLVAMDREMDAGQNSYTFEESDEALQFLLDEKS